MVPPEPILIASGVAPPPIASNSELFPPTVRVFVVSLKLKLALSCAIVEPFEKSTDPAVYDDAPVPPFATGRVPVTSEVRSTVVLNGPVTVTFPLLEYEAVRPVEKSSSVTKSDTRVPLFFITRGLLPLTFSVFPTG